MLNFFWAMYYIFKQPLYISAMYHLGWIYGYEGCLICNVYCKISQKAFKSNRHYIPQSFLRGLISWFQSLNPFLKCFSGRWFRLTADALNDGRAKGLSRLVITTRYNYKKEKKSRRWLDLESMEVVAKR